MSAYPENMNLSTAARYLGTSSVEIKRLLKQQEISASKIRGRWILRKSLLDAWRVRNSSPKVASRSKARKNKALPPIHPAVARLLATLDRLDFSGLEPADWDDAKKLLAEEEASRTKKLIALAERGE